MKELIVYYTMEDSQGAACHGYSEFDWEGYTYITTDNGTYGNEIPFTDEQEALLKKVSEDKRLESWSDKGEKGFFQARVDYGDVKARDLEEFKEKWETKLVDELEGVLKTHFPDYDITVEEA